MNSVLKELCKIGIVPVIKQENPEQALPVAKALLAGGLSCFIEKCFILRMHLKKCLH